VNQGTTGRRTSIVATLGPISETPECIEGLVRAGMDVVRLSMSNGSRDRHRLTARLVRDIAAAQARPVSLLADLQARKNRLGRFAGGGAQWTTGDRVTLTARPGALASDRTWTTYPWDPERVPADAPVYIDDGTIVLAVEQSRRDELVCVVVDGGAVTDGRGVTMPGATAYPPGLTERDTEDLRFAVDLGVEMVAMSFADCADDYQAIRSLAPDQVIIGKVESPTAVRRLPELADAFDGLMVARGDLSQEIPFEDVPLVQRGILGACARRGKIGMVATQVLYSMRTHVRPNPAEVADIGFAVMAGTDALVLTGETGYGRHPVRVVDVLRRIIERAEQGLVPPPTGAGHGSRSDEITDEESTYGVASFPDQADHSGAARARRDPR
jgi:pyruvate kinase